MVAQKAAAAAASPAVVDVPRDPRVPIVRQPLPSHEDPHVEPAVDFSRLVPTSSGALLEPWSEEALLTEDWGDASEVFVDEHQLLPPTLQRRTTAWKRACEVVAGAVQPPEPTAAEAEAIAAAAAEAAELLDPKSKKKKPAAVVAIDEGQQREWKESNLDPETGKVLPRIVVVAPKKQAMTEGEEAVVEGDNKETADPPPADVEWPPDRDLQCARGFMRKPWVTSEGAVPTGEEEVGAPAPAPSAAAAPEEEEPPLEVEQGDVTDFSTRFEERDAVGCCALRLVGTYGAFGEDTPFLWEAIYPQDAQKRPCYNPGGKYVVKLWVGGGWSRMVIDDRIPVDEEGAPTVASSRDRRELWPTLLAKALYKLEAMFAKAPEEEGVDRVSNFVTLSASALAGYTAECYTEDEQAEDEGSWIPQAPLCKCDDVTLAQTATLPSKKRKIGARRKRRAKPLEPSPEVLQEAAEARDVAAGEMRSLLQGPREEILVCVQQGRLGRLVGCRSTATLPLVVEDDVRCCPVLAVLDLTDAASPPLAKFQAGLDPKMLIEEKHLLLEWDCPLASAESYRGEGEEQDESGHLSNPLRQPTHRIAKLADLLAAPTSTTRLLKLRTGRMAPNKRTLRCSWLKEQEVLEPPTTPAYLAPPTAPLAPILLFVGEESSLTLSLEADLLDAEATALAVIAADERKQVTDLEDATIKKEKPKKKKKGEDEEPEEVVVVVDQALEAREAAVRQAAVAAYLGRASVLEIQELTAPSRKDFEDPELTTVDCSLVRAEVQVNNGQMRTSSTTLAATGPRLYRVRLETPLGGVASFASSATNVMLGSIHDVYPQIGGRLATHRGRHCSVAKAQSRVFLRRVIHLPEKAAAPEETASSSNVVEVKLELWMEKNRPECSIHLVDLETSEQEDCSSLTENKPLKLRRGGKGYLVTATLRAGEEDLPSGEWTLLALSDNDDDEAPALRLVDDPPTEEQEEDVDPKKKKKPAADVVTEVEPVVEEKDFFETRMPTVTRFGASYVANRQLRLFRDVISVPDKCFPLNLRLEVNGGQPVALEIWEFQPRGEPQPGLLDEAEKEVPPKKGKEVEERPPCGVDVALYEAEARRADGSRGGQLAHLEGEGAIALPCFWPPVREQADSPNRQFVIECQLLGDSVPETLRSERPYGYAGDFTEESSLEWRLDIVAASSGIELRHDSADEVARLNLRRAWEAREPGRAARAKRLLELSTLKPATEEEAEQALEDRIAALGPGIVSPEVERKREQRRKTTGSPEAEGVPDMPAGMEVVTPEIFIERSKKRKAAAAAQYREQALALVKWRDETRADAIKLLIERDQFRSSLLIASKKKQLAEVIAKQDASKLAEEQEEKRQLEQQAEAEAEANKTASSSVAKKK